MTTSDHSTSEHHVFFPLEQRNKCCRGLGTKLHFLASFRIWHTDYLGFPVALISPLVAMVAEALSNMHVPTCIESQANGNGLVCNLWPERRGVGSLGDQKSSSKCLKFGLSYWGERGGSKEPLKSKKMKWLLNFRTVLRRLGISAERSKDSCWCSCSSLSTRPALRQKPGFGKI